MLFSFFVTCNKIGAFTLGGGYAMIPIMEREFVDRHKWMDKQEFMDIMVVAQATPASLPSIWQVIGYGCAGYEAGRHRGAIGLRTFHHSHHHHCHVLQTVQGQLLGGEVLCRHQTGSRSPHRCSLLQNGKNCQDKSLQCLDSYSQLRPHLSFRRLTHLHHHCGWRVGMAVWKDEKGKRVKR